jgi:hypothetical protein
MKLQSIVLAVSLSVLAACGPVGESEPDDSSMVGQVEGAATVNTTMDYEGSCAFLRQCSAYGNPTCGVQRTCSDTTPWVARPSTAYNICGGTVKVCVQGTTNCVNAYAWDTSCCGRWEGNVAVFKALGLSYGDGTNCAGYGRANVTITY